MGLQQWPGALGATRCWWQKWAVQASCWNSAWPKASRPAIVWLQPAFPLHPCPIRKSIFCRSVMHIGAHSCLSDQTDRLMHKCLVFYRSLSPSAGSEHAAAQLAAILLLSQPACTSCESKLLNWQQIDQILVPPEPSTYTCLRVCCFDIGR